MRRVRHLSQCDYIVAIGQKPRQLLALSNCSTILLEKTWRTNLRDDYKLETHARFNRLTLNGLQVMAKITKDGFHCQSIVEQFILRKVSDSDWAETDIVSVTPTSTDGLLWSASINQSTLNPYELSGGECYSIEVLAKRVKLKFRKKTYFNHLGSFDSLMRLRFETNRLELTKLDG